jgi:hypothetical protein
LKYFLILCVSMIWPSTSNAANWNNNSNNLGPTRDGYVNNISPHKHSFALVSQPEPVRYGETSERYELRDGDCGGTDCSNPRYRSEISLEKNKVQARFNEDIWYGWSFYNKNMLNVSPAWNNQLVFGQWKMGGDNPPIFKFKQIGSGSGNWRGCNPKICDKFIPLSTANPKSFDVFVQMDDMKEKYDWGRRENWGLVCRLFNLQDNLKKWVDIVVNTNFSTKDDGYLRIWINGEERCHYRGQLVTIKSKKYYSGPSHRRGIYGSYTVKWDTARPDKKKPTYIAYYDEFRIGKSREEVDIRIIENKGGEAVD